MFKIGVRGFNGNSVAKSVEEVKVGLYCMWVELPSGVRIDGSELSSIRIFVNQDGFTESTIELGPQSEVITKAEVDMFNAPVFVYCDTEGNPLPEKVSA